MTLPDERYRSIRQAEQLLKDLLDPVKTPRVPKIIRQRASGVLRHWPGEYYLKELAAARPDIIQERMEPLHRMIAAWESGVDRGDKS